jgi:hypothetical protein
MLLPISNVIGYYHWPGIWVDSEPGREANAPLGGENFRLTEFEDEIFAGNIEGLEFRALREGRFLFDFSDWPDYVDPPAGVPQFDDQTAIAVRRAEVINSHVLCLHVALARIQSVALRKPVISPLEFISYDKLSGRSSFGWIDQRLTPLLSADSLASYNQLSPNVHDWRLQSRTVVTIATIAESLALLGSLVSHTRLPMLGIADLYLRSAAFFEAHDYNLALVAAWAIIESLLQTQWVQYVDSNRTRTIDGDEISFINADRRTRLLSGRDYTASVVSETLSLVGDLPHDTYMRLDRVRRNRNRFLHELTAVPRASADQALDVAEEMLSLVGDLDLAVPRLSMLAG